MTLTEQIITIGMVVLGTMITRFLPFFCSQQGNLCLSMSSIWERLCRLPYSGCWLSTA